MTNEQMIRAELDWEPSKASCYNHTLDRDVVLATGDVHLI